MSNYYDTLTPTQQKKYDTKMAQMKLCGDNGHSLKHHSDYVECVRCGYTDDGIMPPTFTPAYD